MIPAFGSPQNEQLIVAIERQADLLPWLRAQYKAGATIAASCSGSFLLAESGLLDGKRATTSWWLAPHFERRYPKVHLDLGSMLTDNDGVMCSGAGMSHFDLALYLIGKYGGRNLARLCAKYVVLADQRRSQTPYIILNHARTYDPLVTKAEKWIKANLRKTISVEDIASHVCASTRTVIRHFKESTGDAPQIFLQKVRVETSKALLENTHLRMSEILDRVGYGDDSTFRRLFRNDTGVSPSEYRRRFGIKQ